jgi:TPR repeat protein
MTRIAISYRRDDSGVITGRIFDRLAAHYGRDAVFRDIDNIPPGVDFRHHIAGVLEESDILLAVVGPRWLGSHGGRNRLDDQADPVRLEVETGLHKKMPVIPVLVMRATMPRVDRLPDSLKDFAYRNAVRVDDGQDFDVHSARLIRAMDRILRQKQGVSEPEDEPDSGPGLTEFAAAPTQDDRPLDQPFATARVRQATASDDAGPPPVARQRFTLWQAAAGLVVGAVAVTAIILWLRSPTPPDVAQLMSGKEAAEGKAATLQTELGAIQKKLEATQGSLEAAQKQAADAEKRAQDLQSSRSGEENALAAQKSAVADATSRLAQAQDQAKTLDDQLARSQAQVKTLSDQLMTEKKAHQDTLDQVATLGGQVKTLQAQANAASVQPAAIAPPVAALDDSSWNADQRHQVQADLLTVGYLQGTADGNFGPATRTAIKQYRSLTGEAESEVMTNDDAAALHNLAQRLSALLQRADTSPDGVPAAAVKGAAQRYQRAWAAEKGSNGAADPAEAIYWYGLAAADGDGKALINLGTLLIRGQGVAKPDPDGARVLWEAAAARGEVTAMFNLGAMYEHGAGITVDLDQAKAWYERAAMRGDAGARAALKRLGA